MTNLAPAQSKGASRKTPRSHRKSQTPSSSSANAQAKAAAEFAWRRPTDLDSASSFNYSKEELMYVFTYMLSQSQLQKPPPSVAKIKLQDRFKDQIRKSPQAVSINRVKGGKDDDLLSKIPSALAQDIAKICGQNLKILEEATSALPVSPPIMYGPEDSKFVISDSTKYWVASQPLIVRREPSVSSEEITRIDRGSNVELTGEIERINFNDRGEILRVRIILPPPQKGGEESIHNRSERPQFGWITANSTGAGPDGKIYLETPSSDIVSEAGYSAYLQWDSYEFIATEDLLVHANARPLGNQQPIGIVHWGRTIKFSGIPIMAGDQVRFKLADPINGWVTVKDFSAEVNAARVKARPLEPQIPNGLSGRFRSETVSALRSDVDPASSVIGTHLRENSIVEQAGPCVTLPYKDARGSGIVVRMPVNDGRVEMFSTRWVTAAAYEDSTNRYVRYFSFEPAVKPKVVCSPIASENLSAEAKNFVPGQTFHVHRLQPEKTEARSSPVGSPTGIPALFPLMDDALGLYEVVYPVRPFSAPSLLSVPQRGLPLGTKLNQTGPCVWRADSIKIGEEPVERAQTIYSLWAPIENQQWVTLIEVQHENCGYVKYCKRIGDALGAGINDNIVPTSPSKLPLSINSAIPNKMATPGGFAAFAATPQAVWPSVIASEGKESKEVSSANAMIQQLLSLTGATRNAWSGQLPPLPPPPAPAAFTRNVQPAQQMQALQLLCKQQQQAVLEGDAHQAA